MDDLLARLLEKVENRYYGKYRAFVVDNADPENRGRLRLRIPSILGNEVASGWALPCAPYGGAADQGFFFIPEKEAGVWVEFEAGNLDYPIWVGTFWSKPGGATEVPKTAAGQSPPTSKIIKTLKHTIEFADKDENEAITITDSMNSNTITLDKNGLRIQDKNGNFIDLGAANGGIAGAKEIKINGEKRVCLDGLIDWLIKHKHVGNLGAPCPLDPGDLAKLTPLMAKPDGKILSELVKAG